MCCLAYMVRWLGLMGFSLMAKQPIHLHHSAWPMCNVCVHLTTLHSCICQFNYFAFMHLSVLATLHLYIYQFSNLAFMRLSFQQPCIHACQFSNLAFVHLSIQQLLIFGLLLVVFMDHLIAKQYHHKHYSLLPQVA